MITKRKLFNTVSDMFIGVTGLNRPIQLYRAFFARIDARKQINVRGSDLLFDANEELHLLRANILNTKEPETLDWIDGFEQGSVFFDIGANIGVFSLYAAVKRGCSVVAFEPESQNYACLNKNIYLNGLSEKITALNVGLHDRVAIDYLNLGAMESGAANHSIGESIDWRGDSYCPEFKQAVLTYSLDCLLEKFQLSFPAHIKIDVDGNELRILEGAAETLKNNSLRSVLIEMRENNGDLIRHFTEAGMRLSETHRAKMQGEDDDLVNAIFVRD